MKDKKIIVIGVVLLILVAAGSFLGGMKYQQSKNPRAGFFQSQRNGQTGQRGQGLSTDRQGLRPVAGRL